MTANRLESRQVEKVWGRQDLPLAFGAEPHDGPVGEIWFQDHKGEDSPLLVKYLLTCETLSIQVHPDDAAAEAQGLKRGKDEAWLIVDAEPEARIGLGLTGEVTREALREAAIDGSIEQLVDWRPVKAGDFLYSPGGTIHALGPGLTLIEIQENADLTYRLYDHGRGRPLQLDDAIAVARPVPYQAPCAPYELSPGREILVEGAAFVVERWSEAAGGRLAGKKGRPVWLIPVRGGGMIDGEPLAAPSVWLVEDQSRVRIDPGAEIVFAYPGAGVIADLLVDTRVAEDRPADERRVYVPPVRLAPTFRP